jgi:hypothetical protein
MPSSSFAPGDRRRSFRTSRRMKWLGEFVRFTGGLTIAATLSILSVKYVIDPDAREQIRAFVGIQDVVTLDDDTVLIGNVPEPDEDRPSFDDDATDPCEKPLELGCDFVEEPDIAYLLMPPFVGPWEEPRFALARAHLLMPFRLQLVCRLDDP